MIARFSPAVALLLVILSSVPARADEVVLRTGSVLTGKVVRETEDQVEIRTEAGSLRLPRGDVAEIRRGGEPEPAAGVPPKGWTRPGIDPRVAPVLDSGRLYVAAADGRVLCLDPARGTPLWATAVGRVVGLAADPGGVYVTTADGDARGLMPGSGRRLWRTPLGRAALGAPVILGRRVHVLLPGASVESLAAGTGRRVGLLPIEGGPDSPLVAAGGALLLGVRDRGLLVLDPDGAEVRGEVGTDLSFGGAAPVARDRIAVVARKGRLLSVDHTTGRVVFDAPVPGLLTPPLAAEASRVYVNLAGVLAAVDAANGRVLWRAVGAGAAVRAVVHRAALYATTTGGRVVRIAPASGRVLGVATPPSPPVGPPRPADGRVIVVTTDGRLRALPLAAPPDRERTAPRVLRSPDGYRFELPAGWRVAATAPIPGLSLALVPDGTAPRFGLLAESSTDLRKLELTGWIAVALLDYSADSPDALVAYRLSRARKRAAAKGYRITGVASEPVEIGGRRGALVTFQEIRSRETMGGEWLGKAVVLPLADGRHASIHLRVPMRFREPGEEAFARFLGSLAAEDPGEFTPEPGVRVLESFLAALDSGDLAAARGFLSPPLARQWEAEPPSIPDENRRLVVRAGEVLGTRRRVTVRVSTGERVRGLDVVVAREAGRWVVADAGALLSPPASREER